VDRLGKGAGLFHPGSYGHTVRRLYQTLEGFIASTKKGGILRRHQNFQRLLRPIVVFNPFARLLTYQDHKLWVRRDHPKYLQLINAIAFLHQFQRPLKRKEGIDYIEVTLEDIALANEIAGSILGRSMDELSSPARRLLGIIQNLAAKKKKQGVEEVQFIRREIREASGWGETYVRSVLRELTRMEYIGIVRGAYGQTFRYELLQEEASFDPFMQSLTNVNELQLKAKKLGILNWNLALIQILLLFF